MGGCSFFIIYLWEYDIDLDAAADVQTSVYDVLMDKVDGIAKTEKSPDVGCYLRLERLGEAAGLHLVFSVPLVCLMLKFTVQPSDSVIALTACLSFLAFAVANMFVYTLTTKTYYRIVDRD